MISTSMILFESNRVAKPPKASLTLIASKKSPKVRVAKSKNHCFLVFSFKKLPHNNLKLVVSFETLNGVISGSHYPNLFWGSKPQVQNDFLCGVPFAHSKNE